jgi:4'-phosphopantetheinyl transferase
LSRSPKNNPDLPSAILWLVDEREVLDEDFAFFLQKLGPSETERYARFARPERRRQFVLGRILLRIAVSRLTGVPPAAIAVEEWPGAAPRLIFPSPPTTQPAFSLSHSGPWVACAASCETGLGLDIEVIDPQRDVLALSASAFHANEHAWLMTQPDAQRRAAFYDLWSIREALYKLLPDSEGHGLPVVASPEDGVLQSGTGWHCTTLSDAHRSLAVCSATSLPTKPVVETITLGKAVWLDYCRQLRP